MAKIVGDLCGRLTCFSGGFAVFVVVFWFTVESYRVDVWPVVSIMMGIALGCLFARVSLLLSHCPNCTPNEMFKPLVVQLTVFVAIGVISGVIMQFVYNDYWAEQMCRNVDAGLEPNVTNDMVTQCQEYQRNVQRWIDTVLVVVTLFLIFDPIIRGWRRFRRMGRGGTVVR